MPPPNRSSKEGNDAHVIRRLQAGDTQVLAEVLERHEVELRRRLSRIYAGALAQDLDDLLAEGLVRLWDARGGLDLTTDLAAWLYVVVRNLGVDVLRARARGSSGAPVEASDPAAERPGAAPLAQVPSVPAQLLVHAMEDLDETDRRILMAFAHNGESGRWAADLSEELDLTANAIRVRKHRLLKRLRAAVTGLADVGSGEGGGDGSA